MFDGPGRYCQPTHEAKLEKYHCTAQRVPSRFARGARGSRGTPEQLGEIHYLSALGRVAALCFQPGLKAKPRRGDISQCKCLHPCP